MACWMEGISPEELAQACRLTLNEVMALEAGILAPPLWQVLLMADFLGVDRDWLCRLAIQAGRRKEVHVVDTPDPEAKALAAGAL